RIEHEPCAPYEYFDVGVKIRRPERRVRSIVDARNESSRVIERPTTRDHGVGKIPAYTCAITQRVDRRRRAVGGADLKTAIPIDPIAHCLHLVITARHVPEGVPRTL